MAKGKQKPASRPKAKKAEPILKKDVAKKKVEKVKLPKKKVGKIVEVKSSGRATVAGKHTFPTANECKHEHTKRTIDRRMRVMHVCLNPICKKVVRYGAR